jgi:hypothetical protein
MLVSSAFSLSRLLGCAAVAARPPAQRSGEGRRVTRFRPSARGGRAEWRPSSGLACARTVHKQRFPDGNRGEEIQQKQVQTTSGLRRPGQGRPPPLAIDMEWGRTDGINRACGKGLATRT